MKPTRNFKMNGQTKVMLALMCKTKENRSHYKKMMIQSQLASEVRRGGGSLRDNSLGD